MLWYKTWCETRVRFVIGVLVLAWICAVIVLLENSSRRHAGQAMTYVSYIWNAVYKDYVRSLFVLLTIVLGGGSLLQERFQGTVGFTLTLPVSRTRLVAVRAAVGVAEVFLLALVPAIVIPVCSPLTGESYPFIEALRFSLLWAGCGTVIFGAAVLLSCVLASEYTAWIVCFLAVMLYAATLNLTPLRYWQSADLFQIMRGSTVPWLPLSVMQAMALGFLMLADRITRRRDF